MVPQLVTQIQVSLDIKSEERKKHSCVSSITKSGGYSTCLSKHFEEIKMTKSNRHCEVIFTHSGLTLQILECIVLCFFNLAGQQFSVSLKTLQAISVTKGWRCLSLTM